MLLEYNRIKCYMPLGQSPAQLCPTLAHNKSRVIGHKLGIGQAHRKPAENKGMRLGTSWALGHVTEPGLGHRGNGPL